jgi:3-oxoacyl-(acyl-carrier-protein) synthase
MIDHAYRNRSFRPDREPIVITGIGMLASVGDNREAVWEAVRNGQSGVRSLSGLPSIPDGLLVGAPTHIDLDYPGQLKVMALAKRAATEAIEDAGLDLNGVASERFACAISGHMGDSAYIPVLMGRDDMSPRDAAPWWGQWMPNTACSYVANYFGLRGPRISHSVACASGMVDILAAVRSIRDGQCDLALAGSAEAFHPLFAAGFHQMKVLAYHDDPTKACRPFDRNRSGFVMGEGAAMFIIERLSHALRRRAKIYAEIMAGKMLAEAHHVTGLDEQSEALSVLISTTLRQARLAPSDLGYVNAHGTGTQQNDVVEVRGIRGALGSAADRICVSATKSMLGHLVNASGSVELAVTTLALRDGFLPPTINLTDPDPQCDLDCIPLVGRARRVQHAMKLSVAFGGHLVAMIVRRWNDTHTGFAYPNGSSA